MTVNAYAKVNFTLEVLGDRPDGYHELRSLVVPISLADEVTLAPADEVTLEVVGCGDRGATALSDIGVDDNLAMRAARLMQRVSGRKEGVSITLEKRIPVGGGLGGGSADAAAVLNGLNEMWGLGIPKSELAILGAAIGSDVPALVLGGPVLMEGRGERVTECLVPGAVVHGTELKRKDGHVSNAPSTKHQAPSTFHLVLANPGAFCSTAEIFKAFAPHLPNRPEILYNIRLAMQAGDDAAVALALQNDLEATAVRLHPEIGVARRRLEEAGCLGVSMSGSGATVFGIVRGASEAECVARKLSEDGLWAAAVETVR